MATSFTVNSKRIKADPNQSNQSLRVCKAQTVLFASLFPYLVSDLASVSLSLSCFPTFAHLELLLRTSVQQGGMQDAAMRCS